LAPCGMGNISSMNMRERGLIGTRPLLFVVKVKRPRFEVHREAFSPRTSVEVRRGGHGWFGVAWSGMAVLVRYGAARYGPVGNGEAVMVGCDRLRLGGSRSGGQGAATQGWVGRGMAVVVRRGQVRIGKAFLGGHGLVGWGMFRRGKAWRSRSGVFDQGPDGHG
jgi:hypothetical protein